MVTKFLIRSISALAFAGLVLLSVRVSAQAINPQNLSTLRVDELSDDQIRSFVSQASASGVPESQLETMALSRGMSATEVQKLRNRIQKLGLNSATAQKASKQGPITSQRQLVDSVDTLQHPDTLALQRDTVPEVFGAALFKKTSTKFEDNLRLPTPKNYIIGASDELIIDIYGYSEASYNLDVTPDGNINIPLAGVVKVGGSSIEQATVRIREKLAKIYSGITNGTTNVNVGLGNIRSIRVVLTGEVTKPGTYTISSLATAFNALYTAGGPGKSGSYRNIQIIRDGKNIGTLDIYEFLMQGKFQSNPVLQDQDVILVPTYQTRVRMTGEVKRPMLFELKEGETFQDLLSYAGGFTENAYQARVYVMQNTATEHKVADVLQSQFSQFEPHSGDEYHVEKILDRFTNRVEISGAVFRPGNYELSSGLSLSMLLKKAEGPREDAFMKRGYIFRLKDDLQPEQISFNVAAILAGTEPDIPLKREDHITITSIFDLKEQYTVKIDGEVRAPGQFIYAEGMTLEELIMMAGGFRESATSKRIEVSRRVRNSDSLSTSASIAQVFQVDASTDLSKDDAGFKLDPFDLVVIRTAPGYESQKTVRIEGEVIYPGIYSITKKDERISDLVKRAGGLTPFAYSDGASMKRGVDGDTTLKVALTNAEKAEKELEQQEEEQRNAALIGLQQSVNASADENQILEKSRSSNTVGINLTHILKGPGKLEDLLLEDGDIIRVPKQLQTVTVKGEVLSPVTAVYAGSKSFKDYVSEAGGFSQRALKKRSYVVYANGVAQSTKHFLFFNNYPDLKPGAEIFVPQKLERARMSPQEWIGIGTGFASLAAIIVSLLK